MRIRQMSRGVLLTRLWEAVPKRYQDLFDHATRITVIGSVLGACGQDGPGWIVVRLVNGSIRGRKVTLLAMAEDVTTEGVRHRAGPIETLTWANWTPDYPSDCSDRVYERMMRRHAKVTNT